MKENQILKSSTENTRFLYKTIEYPFFNWQSSLDGVDQLRKNYPNWSLANNQAHFYFFAPSANERFEELPCWIGRELVGYSTFENENEGYGLMDFDHGEIIQNSRLLPLGSEGSFEKLFEMEQEGRKETESEYPDINLAETWKLSVDLKPMSSHNEKLAIKIIYFIA